MLRYKMLTVMSNVVKFFCKQSSFHESLLAACTYCSLDIIMVLYDIRFCSMERIMML